MTRRLLATYLTITAFTLVVLVLPLGATFASRERDRLMRDIERDASVVATLVEDALEAGTVPDVATLLSGYTADPGGRIVVVDRRGISVADSSAAIADAPRDFSTRPEIARALGGDRAEGTRPSDTLGGDLVFVAVPVASGGRVHGAVRITYPTSAMDARVRAVWWRLAGLSAVVLAAVTAVGLVLARGVSGPVRRLQGAAAALAGGALSTRVPTEAGAPELRALAETFNETAARLEALLGAQQAFVADASHQLRTPLAALRLRLENLRATAPADALAEVDAAQAEATRLARLVEHLLTLARTEARRVDCGPVDLAAAARERVEVWAPLAAEDGVTLVAEVSDTAVAWADAESVEQILDNLVANALDASPAPGVVRVVVHAGKDGVELHVIDEGSGLDDTARARAFDRFWRAPGAKPGGSGLGLAISAQLAAACGAQVELLQAAPHGIDAVVRFRPATLAKSLPHAHLAQARP